MAGTGEVPEKGRDTQAGSIPGFSETPASGHVQDGKTPSDLGNVGDSLELTGGRHLRILL